MLMLDGRAGQCHARPGKAASFEVKVSDEKVGKRAVLEMSPAFIFSRDLDRHGRHTIVVRTYGPLKKGILQYCTITSLMLKF